MSRWPINAATLTRSLLIGTAALLLSGCSSGEAVPIPPDAGEDAATDSSPDLAPDEDATPAPDSSGRDTAPPEAGPDPDAGPGPDATVDSGPDAGCALGTADHCAACGDKCPGPQTGDTTQRACVGGKCEIQCEEEHYDVDGEVDNGCEAMDDLPIHESLTDPADMGTHSDCGWPQSETAVLPSDDRKHIKAPADRPNGRTDYFIFGIDDDFGCSVTASIDVSFAGLPPTAKYQVEAAYRCADKTLLATVDKNTAGGQVVNLRPDTACTIAGFGDDSGVLILRVQKLSGPHSAASYKVTIEP